MFDKLEDLLIRFEEIMSELHEPTVANNQERFRKLMKEQSDLTPIIKRLLRNTKSAIRKLRTLWQCWKRENDEEMREMIKETLSENRKRGRGAGAGVEGAAFAKDPNDDKNVIVEIRAGAGGDEAALFAAEIYRMYVHYAEGHRWKVETLMWMKLGSAA